MTLKNKVLDLITEADLQSLVENRVREAKVLDYKRALPDKSERQKREFLYDVSSFANASGGDLIFGVTESDGVASEISGLESGNVDEDILRLESIIRDGIEPRIPGLGIRAVSLQTSKVVLIVRIPKSFALPHVVKYDGTFKFYSRTSAGKYQIDVAELRTLFALSETAVDRVKRFRMDRLSKIFADELPVQMIKNPKVVLHIVPVGAFESGVRLDLSAIADDISGTKPMGCGSWDHRYNFDGLLNYGRGQNDAYSYLQIFYHGAIEALQASYLEPEGERRIYRSRRVEEALTEGVSRYMRVLEKLGVGPPLFVMLTLLGVAGYRLDRSDFDDHTVDRNDLIIPEVRVDEFNANAYEVMRPIFDSVWNAAGCSRDMNFDEDGKWISK